MRNISFALKTQQVRDRTCDVTRRLGWGSLKGGEILRAIEKGQGLKKGETVKEICLIRTVIVRRELLRAMIDSPDYGFEEIRREGFADHPNESLRCPSSWVKWFCESHAGCTPDTEITRIEFCYAETEKPR